MNKETIISHLYGDLANEYKHLHFYLNAAARVTGPSRIELKEFFLEQAASELKHVSQFSDMIVGLGGTPTTTVAGFEENISNPVELLQAALVMENEVLHNYAERMSQADELGGVDGRWIVIFLENQMEDTRTDVDELKQLVRI